MAIMSKITVIDYGVGNIASVVNMIEHVGGEAVVVSEPSKIRYAEKLLLPGVGAYDHGMQCLIDNKWVEVLSSAVLEAKIPILGICLGMQLMCNSSEEGSLGGLAWIDATVSRFSFETAAGLKVPHMGWNPVTAVRGDAILSPNKGDLERFYFVHSYYVECICQQDVILRSHYGHDFVAGFQRENIWGLQFHPEKSHRFGMEIFRRFLEI